MQIRSRFISICKSFLHKPIFTFNILKLFAQVLVKYSKVVVASYPVDKQITQSSILDMELYKFCISILDIDMLSCCINV